MIKEKTPKTDLRETDRFRKGFVLALTIVLGTAFLALIADFLVPLVLAMLLSALCQPLYLKVKKWVKGHDGLASLITLFILLVAVVGPLVFILVLLAEQAGAVADSVKPWIEKEFGAESASTAGLFSKLPFAAQLEPYREIVTSKLGEFAEMLGVYLASSLGKLSKGTLFFFLQLFIMLYAVFTFLIHGSGLVWKFISYVPLAQVDKERMVAVCLSVTRATVKGTFIIGIIQGVLGGLGFAVAGIGSPVFWAAMMAIVSVIPGIGPTLVWVPVAIYLATTGHLVAAVALSAWCAVVVGTIDNVLRPKLVGRDAKMPDLLILLSTLGGLSLFGASGLVLGPVLAALFMAVLTTYSQVFSNALELDEFPNPK